MSSSSLPQGFSIFQPALGAQLQFFPAVGTQELDELIHAHLVGPASSQEKRATLALDFFEHAQMTGQSFKFYPVYTVAASPATSASSSFNTSPATTTWDWSQTSRAASVSSRSSQHRVSKPKSPASRMRPADFSSLPGMKIMTKDGLDVTNSASRGSKTKEQRDHAHLMRIIKACDSCKRKKIRCDPSHKKRSSPAQAAPATSSKATKAARTASPPAAQTVSLPQSISPQSVSPPLITEDFTGFTASPFELDATFSFDTIDTCAADLAAPSDPWEEFVQYPPMDDVEDYDFFADPSSFLSSQSSDAGLSTSNLSVSASPDHVCAAPGRGPDGRLADSRAQAHVATADTSASLQLPFESAASATEYTDFSLYSPSSIFSEDDRMVDISSSTSGLSTQSMPSPIDSPDRPPNAPSLERDITSAIGGTAIEQPPFTSVQESGPTQPANVQARAEDGNMAGALSVLSRSDIVMRTNEQGQLIICCPPGTVVNSSRASSNAGEQNVSTVNDSNSSSFYISSELSESAVASVSSAAGDVGASVTTWLDGGEGTSGPGLPTPMAATEPRSPMLLADGIERSQSSRFVHRNTDVAQGSSNVTGHVADLDVHGPVAESPGVPTTNGDKGNGLSAGFATVTCPSSSVSQVSASERSAVTSTPFLAPFPVPVLGGYVSDESGSTLPAQSDIHNCDDGVSAGELTGQTQPALSLSHASVKSLPSDCGGQALTRDASKPTSSEQACDQYSDLHGTDDSNLDASPLSPDSVNTSSPVTSSTGRAIMDSDSPHDAGLAIADATISHRDTTGIGRSVLSHDGQERVNAAALISVMQTAVTYTLLATYAQSVTTATAGPSVPRRAWSEDTLGAHGGVLAMSQRAIAVC